MVWLAFFFGGGREGGKEAVDETIPQPCSIHPGPALVLPETSNIFILIPQCIVHVATSSHAAYSLADADAEYLVHVAGNIRFEVF
jgi:hypothetical protein